jgi:uncharacterized protein YgiM (DUF1202 family)
VTLAVCLALVLGFVGRARAQEAPKLVVTAKTSLVRVEPSLEAKVVVAADRNAEFTVTGSTEGWLKVAVGTTGEGWLPKAEIGLKVEHNGEVCVEFELSDGLKVAPLKADFTAPEVRRAIAWS